MALTATSTLILGQPGTGKSFYAKSVAKASSLKVYVINGQEKDYNLSDGFKHISYDDLAADQGQDGDDDYDDDDDDREIMNCILIIDDIVRPKDYQAKIINEQLVHRKRHDNITTFALSHGIEKNNLNSLLKHFDFVMFTNSQTNTPVFKSYAKKYCPLPFTECMLKWEDFVNSQSKTMYLRYSNSNSQFDIVDVKGNVITNRDNKLRKKVHTYLSALGETKVAMALYDFLTDVLPPGVITDSLQLNVKDVNSKKKKSISIIDVLFYVTTKKEDLLLPPRQEIIDVFKSMQKMFNIPNVFTRNHYFQ